MVYMEFYEVSPVGIIGHDITVLTYGFSEKLSIGTIVEIPVGKRTLAGVILRHVSKPDFETKDITHVLIDKPLPPGLLSLHKWLSDHYTTHPGTVWQTMLPAGLGKKRRKLAPKPAPGPTERKADITLTNDQIAAISKLVKMKSGTAILRGITGSGKTEVYKALALEAAARGKSSIILVPEIALTAQLVDEFRCDFDNVIVTHSGQTEAERFATWKSALDTTGPTIVIGPRSALFLPLCNLGLIVVDECHEPSYKQEKAPRYNALRAASVLAEANKSRLVLGSATPLIADVYTARKLGRPIVEMTTLARRDAVKPETTIIDMTRRDAFSRTSQIFSKMLIEEIEKVLHSKRQVLLFHNRRGTASVTLCENCGWIATCPRCYLPLTLHADKFELRCHICGHSEKPQTKCPDCNYANIIHRGIGTKRIEEEITRLFPEAHVKRFDGDSARGEGVHDLFSELKRGEIDIIIGTQTVAKGLDLPNLALVGIVQADAGLVLPDFSASERTFQLIAQATGRVGRSQARTRVIVQTFQPVHPAVICGSAQDYDKFYEDEIKNRQLGHFPPFTHLLKMTCAYKTEHGAINAAKKLAAEIRSEFGDQVKILGPAPAFYERQRDNYRWQIVVRSASRAKLSQIAAKVPLTKWQVELDPNSLI